MTGDDALTPTEVFLKGRRSALDYSVRDAVEYYCALHPDADEKTVKAEIERVAWRLGDRP